MVPQGVGPARLGQLDGAAVGLMNPGLGDVSPVQTWLDISQGARAFDSAYDASLNKLFVTADRLLGWETVEQRAAEVTATIRPGLLATTLARNGLSMTSSEVAGNAAVIAANRSGRLVRAPMCRTALCPWAVQVTRTSLAGAIAMANARRPQDLLMVIESPPAESGDQLSMAIAGPGFQGALQSESTRTDGYVLSTDIAPTVLAHFGIEAPNAMTGLPLGSGGEVDFPGLRELEGRYQEVGKRRGAALLLPLLIWMLTAAGAAAVTRGRLARPAVKLLALSTVLLPAALLLTASFSPSLAVEQAVATVLPVLVAFCLLRLLPGYQSLAVASMLTVGPYAIDMLAGSVLTPKAVVGPNPGLGARFYGIGNELESSLMILASVGTGAALTSWGVKLNQKQTAGVFLGVGLVCSVIFAAGRFGADVGAAIIFPTAAVVAAAFVLGRPRLAWLAGLIALVSLILLALGDSLTGGESHYLRSLFDGSSGDSTLQVLTHRIEETAASFTRVSRLPVTLLAFALIALAFFRRELIESWLRPVPVLRAALIAASIASVVGAASNDSGALFIQVGVLFIGLVVGFCWAEANETTDN